MTIHVHQRDVMNDLATLHRHKRISDANDFEWLKQVPCFSPSQLDKKLEFYNTRGWVCMRGRIFSPSLTWNLV